MMIMKMMMIRDNDGCVKFLKSGGDADDDEVDSRSWVIYGSFMVNCTGS